MSRRIVTLGDRLLRGLAGCGEENLERAQFNAYFYYPDNREEFLRLGRTVSPRVKARLGDVRHR